MTLFTIQLLRLLKEQITCCLENPFIGVCINTWEKCYHHIVKKLLILQGIPCLARLDYDKTVDLYLRGKRGLDKTRIWGSECSWRQFSFPDPANVPREPPHQRRPITYPDSNPVCILRADWHFFLPDADFRQKAKSGRINQARPDIRPKPSCTRVNTT